MHDTEDGKMPLKFWISVDLITGNIPQLLNNFKVYVSS